MKTLTMILLCGLLAGCGLVEAYVDGIGNIFKTDKQRLDELVPRMDKWLGQTKDALIKQRGLPSGCTTLMSGEEVCEWVRGGTTAPSTSCHPNAVTGRQDCYTSRGSNWEHRFLYTFDRDGIAREWLYTGYFGRRSSSDPKPSAEPVPVSKPE